jgi:hypothetical protein
MAKTDANLMNPVDRLQDAPRCHAKAKSSGVRCKCPAVRGCESRQGRKQDNRKDAQMSASKRTEPVSFTSSEGVKPPRATAVGGGVTTKRYDNPMRKAQPVPTWLNAIIC